MKFCYPIVELLQVDDRAGLSLLSRLVGAIAVVVGHFLGPLVRVAIQAAIACKQIAITSHRQNLKSSSPTSPILHSLMFYLELQSIHHFSPLKLVKSRKTLQKPPRQHGFGGQEIRTREARFAGLIPGRCVEIAAPFHAHCRQEAARNLSCGSAKSEAGGDGFSYGRLKCCSGHRKTGYSVIHWCSPGFRPPCHGISSNRNILHDTVR